MTDPDRRGFTVAQKPKMSAGPKRHRGSPCFYGFWQKTTFIPALRHDGVAAPFVLDGPINGEWFLAYVKEVLVPTLSPRGGA